MGYLEGTQKAAHTIKNYRFDLNSFHEFLQKGYGDRPLLLKQFSADDLEHYHTWLKKQGLKTNTRRRRLLTAQRFLHYLVRRSKLPEDAAKKFPTPHKVERIPTTVPAETLLAAIRALPVSTLLDSRNRALLWTLAETGCQVSELSKLRHSDVKKTSAGRAVIDFPGKSARTVEISPDLYSGIQKIAQLQPAKDADREWIFQGFNKFGSLGGAITPRGIELLVKQYAPRLGLDDLTPRTFRHSIVLKWMKEGEPKDEIQKRLGLKSAYAFRVYDAMFAGKRTD